jgi:hypothetical protein
MQSIEKNPGPSSYVDPNKTIAAPYSQGNELLFGQSAGQQCIAMSLCSLIYNNTKGISSTNDLIQIMARNCGHACVLSAWTLKIFVNNMVSIIL